MPNVIVVLDGSLLISEPLGDASVSVGGNGPEVHFVSFQLVQTAFEALWLHPVARLHLAALNKYIQNN